MGYVSHTAAQSAASAPQNLIFFADAALSRAHYHIIMVSV